MSMRQWQGLKGSLSQVTSCMESENLFAGRVCNERNPNKYTLRGTLWVYIVGLVGELLRILAAVL